MAARSGRTDLPHDLAHFVVEAGLRLEHGFRNLVANGATFRSLGRRPTMPGAAAPQAVAARPAAAGPKLRWRSGAPPTPTSMRSWPPSGSAASSRTAWPGSKAALGC